jgi:hypothetical protein
MNSTFLFAVQARGAFACRRVLLFFLSVLVGAAPLSADRPSRLTQPDGHTLAHDKLNANRSWTRVVMGSILP